MRKDCDLKMTMKNKRETVKFCPPPHLSNVQIIALFGEYTHGIHKIYLNISQKQYHK